MYHLGLSCLLEGQVRRNREGEREMDDFPSHWIKAFFFVCLDQHMSFTPKLSYMECCVLSEFLNQLLNVHPSDLNKVATDKEKKGHYWLRLIRAPPTLKLAQNLPTPAGGEVGTMDIMESTTRSNTAPLPPKNDRWHFIKEGNKTREWISEILEVREKPDWERLTYLMILMSYAGNDTPDLGGKETSQSHCEWRQSPGT